jgi:hypothetical protein
MHQAALLNLDEDQEAIEDDTLLGSIEDQSDDQNDALPSPDEAEEDDRDQALFGSVEEQDGNCSHAQPCEDTAIDHDKVGKDSNGYAADFPMWTKRGCSRGHPCRLPGIEPFITTCEELSAVRRQGYIPATSLSNVQPHK